MGLDLTYYQGWRGEFGRVGILGLSGCRGGFPLFGWPADAHGGKLLCWVALRELFVGDFDLMDFIFW